MKYMGSKRAMLENGLGQLIRRHAESARRFVDLFSGSGAVSWFVAESIDKQTVAFDLQQYAAVLAGSVVGRTKPLDSQELVRSWLEPSLGRVGISAQGRAAVAQQTMGGSIGQWVKAARSLCLEMEGGPVWRAYGGYYFSPLQAATIDCLLAGLPETEPTRSVCQAATIMAASRTAASPGHTAQPFRPTRTAGPFLREAWNLDVAHYAKEFLSGLSSRHALVRGRAAVADAGEAAGRVREGDLVFVDPPYSAVQYSRFYHVLETIARGTCGPVSGSGRYPNPLERPVSRFSQVTYAATALEHVLERLAGAGCRVILTFPAKECSNGISGDQVTDMASDLFKITERLIGGKFSTMGGNGRSRDARQSSAELILFLTPR